MKIKSIHFLILGLLVGCSSGPYVPKADSTNPETANAPLVLLDKDLRRVLAVDKNVVAQRNANNLLAIHATLRNMTHDETLHIQVQTLFKDENGRVLYSQTGSEAPWQSMSLTPGQMSYYSQSALTSEATQFTIRVRYAQPKPEEDD